MLHYREARATEAGSFKRPTIGGLWSLCLVLILASCSSGQQLAVSVRMGPGRATVSGQASIEWAQSPLGDVIASGTVTVENGVGRAPPPPETNAPSLVCRLVAGTFDGQAVRTTSWVSFNPAFPRVDFHVVRQGDARAQPAKLKEQLLLVESRQRRLTDVEATALHAWLASLDGRRAASIGAEALLDGLALAAVPAEGLEVTVDQGALFALLKQCRTKELAPRFARVLVALTNAKGIAVPDPVAGVFEQLFVLRALVPRYLQEWSSGRFRTLAQGQRVYYVGAPESAVLKALGREGVSPLESEAGLAAFRMHGRRFSGEALPLLRSRYREWKGKAQVVAESGAPFGGLSVVGVGFVHGFRFELARAIAHCHGATMSPELAAEIESDLALARAIGPSRQLGALLGERPVEELARAYQEGASGGDAALVEALILAGWPPILEKLQVEARPR